MAGSEEELKSLLMTVKKESEKAGLTFNTEKTKIMATGPITSWQINGEKVDLFPLGCYLNYITLVLICSAFTVICFLKDYN